MTLDEAIAALLDDPAVFRWMDREPRHTHDHDTSPWVNWLAQHGIDWETVLIANWSAGIAGWVRRDIERRRVYWLSAEKRTGHMSVRHVQLESPPLPFPTEPPADTSGHQPRGTTCDGRADQN